MWLIFILLVVVPYVEVTLLLKLADYTSWYTALGVTMVTAVVGVTLARQQGLSALRRVSQAMERQEPIGNALADGLMILLAGVLLATPGILTDLLGLSLLIPLFRRAYRVLVVRWLMARVRRAAAGGGTVGSAHYQVWVGGERRYASGDGLHASQPGDLEGRVVDARVLDARSLDRDPDERP